MPKQHIKCYICANPLEKDAPELHTKRYCRKTEHVAEYTQNYRICSLCYARGDYGRLACAVVARAMDDYYDPKPNEKGETKVRLWRDAYEFVFNSPVFDWWCAFSKTLDPIAIRGKLNPKSSSYMTKDRYLEIKELVTIRHQREELEIANFVERLEEFNELVKDAETAELLGGVQTC
jgi:hypothetical protein